MNILKSTKKIQNNFKGVKQLPLARGVVILLLILVIAIEIIPNYLSKDSLPWKDVAQVENINFLRSIRKNGINIPEWKRIHQTEVKIGQTKWLVQSFTKGNESLNLFILPQVYYKNKPEVEWTDIDGRQKWKTDSFSHLKFRFTPEGASKTTKTVEARYFRAWNKKRTFAVVQWYAWPTGGSFKPSSWFWADQKAQLRGERAPWIALSILIPIEPLGDVKAVKPKAESIAKTIQTVLFKEMSNSSGT